MLAVPGVINAIKAAELYSREPSTRADDRCARGGGYDKMTIGSKSFSTTETVNV